MSVPDWNVLVTVFEGEFREASALLAPFGRVRGTDYHNVLEMKVGDVAAFLDELRAAVDEDASIANAVSRIVPVTDTFRFHSPEQFEHEAREVVRQWLPELEGRTFHVRMHRRGFKGRLSSQHEEQFLDHFIVEQARLRGRESTVDFDDPDVVVAVETLGQEAGLSRWTRDDLRDNALLRLD